MKQSLQTPQAPAPRGPYSQAVIASGTQVHIAAQGPFDPVSGQLAGDSFETQARRTFENIRSIVEAAGGTMAQVVKVTVCLADWKYFAEMNAIYREFFPEPYPARTPMVMALPAGLIMVDAIVALESEKS